MARTWEQQQLARLQDTWQGWDIWTVDVEGETVWCARPLGASFTEVCELTPENLVHGIAGAEYRRRNPT